VSGWSRPHRGHCGQQSAKNAAQSEVGSFPVNPMITFKEAIRQRGFGWHERHGQWRFVPNPCLTEIRGNDGGCPSRTRHLQLRHAIWTGCSEISNNAIGEQRPCRLRGLIHIGWSASGAFFAAEAGEWRSRS
jgi:hypothetical protein